MLFGESDPKSGFTKYITQIPISKNQIQRFRFQENNVLDFESLSLF